MVRAVRKSLFEFQCFVLVSCFQFDITTGSCRYFSIGYVLFCLKIVANVVISISSILSGFLFRVVGCCP